MSPQSDGLPLEGRAPGDEQQPEEKPASTEGMLPLTAKQQPEEKPASTEGMLPLTAKQFCQAAKIRTEHRGGFLAEVASEKKRTRPEWEVLYRAYLDRPVG